MKKALLKACAICACASNVNAGGLDRSGQGINLIFENGSAVQARLGYAAPNVSGSLFAPGLGDVPSGDVAENFFAPGLGYKRPLTDKLDFALIYDKPFGADVSYPSNYPLSINPTTPLGGRTDVLRAEADFDAITAVLRYKLGSGFSAIGGLRAQRVSANVSVPAAVGYAVDFDDDTDFGYLVGVAWERPEIAARVSLVYSSKITHDVASTESFNQPSAGAPLITQQTQTEIVSPQSVNLDFQTGVAPKTLVFGSIRWVDWPQANLFPPVFSGSISSSNSPLVSFSDDTFTYSLGVGYQFSDAFSGAFSVGYEKDSGGTVSDLGPTGRSLSAGIGGTYSLEKAQISGGIRYTDIGDATTNTGGEFSGNSAWSVGLQVTYALD